MTGCFGFLKPAQSTAKHFVLTPVPAPPPGDRSDQGLAVGVGPVKIPDYLFDSSLAVRRGVNEIDYLPLVLWAERLDAGIQRVMAANLSAMLPTERVRLSAWRREDVDAEVRLIIERFDVDVGGQAMLVAWWRITSPGGETNLETGETRLARAGPWPDHDPAGAIATLSELLAECGRELAQALRTTMNPAPPRP